MNNLKTDLFDIDATLTGKTTLIVRMDLELIPIK